MPEPRLRKDGMRSAERGCGELADSPSHLLCEMHTHCCFKINATTLHTASNIKTSTCPEVTLRHENVTNSEVTLPSTHRR